MLDANLDPLKEKDMESYDMDSEQEAGPEQMKSPQTLSPDKIMRGENIAR